MAVGAGVAGEVHQHGLAFGLRFRECGLKIVFDPGQIAVPAVPSGGRGNVGFDLAQLRAEHSGYKAESEDDEDGADQQAHDPQFGVARDAGQANESEQIESGHREQNDPRGEKTFAREEAGLQHGIETIEILQHRGQHDESHHDFHARQPLAGAGQLLQVFRKQREQEEGKGKSAGKDHHAENRAKLVASDGCRQQGAHERAHAGERGEREGKAHQQRSGKSACVRTRRSASSAARRES